jgi:ATP-dependent helicase Lhr and Lhr-like helicase
MYRKGTSFMDSFERQFHLHPIISSWFSERFGTPTDIQEEAWRSIQSGAHTLVASPTGSGKTLAALLPCLDYILKAKEAAEPHKRDKPYRPGVRVLYITPLKALNNDIHLHLFTFLDEMEKSARACKLPWPGIQVGVRTGDTTASQRSSMLRQPPDLLITTPESFYILMTSEKGRQMFTQVDFIVVDEIHDLAANKRGAHLSLTLERLVELRGHSPLRIGISATQKPLQRVARFLGGWEIDDCEQDQVSADTYRYKPRQVHTIESTTDKQIQLRVKVPQYDTVSYDKENFWQPIVEQIQQALEEHATVLIFANNRRLCERLTLRLNDHVGYEMVRSHHGSVSRQKRLEVEEQLKSGKLKCLVATSSLELGIDVGHVDLVIQIDSPKRAATGIQRIGRAGHHIDGISNGRSRI